MRKTALWMIILLFWGCGKEPPPAGKGTSPGPDQVLEKSSIIFTSEGRRTAVVYADRISKYLKEKKEALQGVKAQFYDEEGRISSTLTSQEGTVREGREEVEAKGRVVVVTSEGVRLETPLLKWNSRTNQVYTDSVVKINRKGDMVTGRGMEADSELKRIKIKAEIKGRIKNLHIDEGL
jgi:LPS export ABC transporter protein LptC